MAAPPRLGIAGLGLVGSALARRAHALGWTVVACDPASDTAQRAAAIGIRVVPDAAALAARCDLLIACVLDDTQLDQVIDAVLGEPAHSATACGGGAASDVGSTVGAARLAPAGAAAFVNAVTCSPAAADRAAARLRASGIAPIELPFSGSSAQIEAGEALALVGAEADDWARHGDALSLLAPNRIHAGPPGAAARAKLASNLVLGLNRAALAEGLALAQGLGLAPGAFLELLRRSPAYSRAVDVAGPRMVARDFTPVSRLSQHRKDLRLIAQAAASAGLALPLATAHATLLDAAIALGLGELDNVAVIDALRPQGAALNATARPAAD
jgi:3-hydroxyisobutyrate dehydrogenase-like beta-hydroxyacid dehydrogenase